MASTAATSSKLLVPRVPSDQVERAHLAGSLAEVARRRLTTVVAGTGYGKSTLVAAWAGDHPVAWYTVDRADPRPADARGRTHDGAEAAGSRADRRPGGARWRFPLRRHARSGAGRVPRRIADRSSPKRSGARGRRRARARRLAQRCAARRTVPPCAAVAPPRAALTTRGAVPHRTAPCAVAGARARWQRPRLHGRRDRGGARRHAARHRRARPRRAPCIR